MIARSSQLELMAQVLEAASLRHSAIAHNLANVNTPNYRRLEVPFEVELDSLLRQGESVTQHQPKMVEAKDAPTRADGNNVDVDSEIAQLQRNALLMAAATQILSLQLSQMRSAISGR